MTDEIKEDETKKRRYYFQPEGNMTAYELAGCLPMILSGGAEQEKLDAMWENMAPDVKRHWKVRGIAL